MGTLQQLKDARTLALGDGRYYPTILPGVLPIIGPNSNATLEIQRFGADFLAETFASPIWSADAKQPLALTVLETLHHYLDAVHDRGVIKSAVQAAASVYPLVFRHVLSDPSDAHHWKLMTAIKSNILSHMDSATPGVRICCVKFVQQVVLVQTPGVIDPRRPDHSDTSLALVSRDHPLMPYAQLEAEGHGLLDRLLDIIHGDHSDALLVTAVLNSLGVLIYRRPIAANKILNSVLSFNPLKLANSPMTPKNRVNMRSIERTTRALLVNLLKRNHVEKPNDPNNGRVQQFLDRMNRMHHDILQEANRKRPAPAEPTDGLDATKRQRVAVAVSAPAPVVLPLPPGPVSHRQLFTLNPEDNTAGFDVQMFKDPELLVQILVPVLQSVDATKLLNASNIVRSRYLSLSKSAPSQPIAQTQDDEDEYEPDFEPEDAEQVENRLDGLASTDYDPAPAAPLAPYKLPEAPTLTPQEVQRYGELAVRRTFGMITELDEKARGSKGGFNRLAASDYGRDAWITIASRLASRAGAGLDDADEGIKDEYAVKDVKGDMSISNTIRDLLYEYVIRDWKRRIDVAISWLNEEWYNDTILAQSAKIAAKTNGAGEVRPPKANYHRNALRLIDGILPYVTGSDKGLIRFYSELPAVDYEILLKVKKMAEDPDRIGLACQVLQYLHMFRPPVKTMVIDVMAEMWRENDRAKPKAGSLLKAWRPEVLQEATENGGETQANGAIEIQASA